MGCGYEWGNKVRYRKIDKHRKGCYSVESVGNKTWSKAWFILGDKLEDSKHEPRYLGNKDGYKLKRGGEYWLVAMCNDPNCKARIAVPENDILKLVPAF